MRKNLAPRGYGGAHRRYCLTHESFPPAGRPAARLSVCGTTYPISDTNTIIHCARRLLNQSYRRDFLYKRTGVYVGEVVPKDAVTKDLFEEPETEQQQIICELMDSINTRYGKNTLCFAASKLGKDTWEMSRARLSPGYTTCWKDLPRIGPLLEEIVPF